MFLATASTKRPIAMSCLLIALIGLGLNSYRKLSIENMPAVDIPYLAVITTWVGASPEDIEKDVSKPIEDAVSGIDGLKHIESSSLDNVSQVILEFNLATDIDTAAQDVREKLDFVLSTARRRRTTTSEDQHHAAPIANIIFLRRRPSTTLRLRRQHIAVVRHRARVGRCRSSAATNAKVGRADRDARRRRPHHL